MKRIKSQALIICKSDKASKLIPVGPSEYVKMREVHVKDDKRISQEDIIAIENVLNHHLSIWMKMLKIGEDWSHTKRFIETGSVPVNKRP